MACARAAEPGSDHQLAWVEALLDSASTDSQIDYLASLLSGEQQLEALAMDTDLRWRVLRALVSRGRAGEAEIAAAAAEDPTAAGAREASTARAQLATAEAKAKAWSMVVSDVELSNAVRSAVRLGLRDPLHPELLEPFTATYFEQAAEIWQRFSPETARFVIAGLFPTWSSAINEDTLRQAAAFLADTGRPAALQRLVSEGRAEVARALRARAADSAAG
jgi:aminopeptidase N